MFDLSPERVLMASKLLELTTFLLATAADALVIEASGRVRSPKIDVGFKRVRGTRFLFPLSNGRFCKTTRDKLISLRARTHH